MSAYLQLFSAYTSSVILLLIIAILSAKYQGRRHAILWAFVVMAVVFFLTGYTRVLLVPFNADESRREFLLTGDEPAYLMTAVSIARDGDLNLANNVASKDYQLFQHRSYVGSGFQFYNSLSHNRLINQKEQWGDARFMRHRPGTSVLLAPVFFLADHNQRFWSYTIISFCFALFCGFSVYYLSQAVTIPLASVLVLCLLCGLSPPVYFYVNQAYPEIPSGILLALISMLFLKPGRTNLIPFALAAIVIWFSDRIILATLIICAGGFFNLPTKKQKVAAVFILGSSGLLFAWYCWHRFGVPYPIQHNTTMGFSWGKIPERLLQILFDARQGWVWHFPAILLLPAMLWKILRSRAVTLNHICLVSALSVLLVLVAAFDDWGAGTCPRGRYFVIPQLLFFVLAGIWLQEDKGRKGKMFWLVGLGSLSLAQLFWLAPHPKWWFAGFQPLFSWQEIHSLIFYLPFLPDNAEPTEWIKFLKMTPLLALPSLSCIFMEHRQQRADSAHGLAED
ncbi:MAG: hypothetical protein KKD01_10740 [Proteobacteria bacterium]|nr:hypothetical protein [Pseudomonadota bacterium]MBU1455192.1 hypothetical protein [Pseudomonadota bacterium]